MKLTDFYKKIDIVGIEAYSVDGFEDVVETLAPEEADKIIDLVQGIDKLQNLIDKKAPSEKIQEAQRELDKKFELLFDDIEKIPAFDETSQTRSEYLKGVDVDKLRGAWLVAKQDSSQRIQELVQRQKDLEIELNSLKGDYKNHEYELKELKNKLNKADYVDDIKDPQNLQKQRDKIDGLEKANGELLERIEQCKKEIRSIMKENAFQTFVNNYAKTQESQILSLLREKTLAQERDSISETQKELDKKSKDFRTLNSNQKVINTFLGDYTAAFTIGIPKVYTALVSPELLFIKGNVLLESNIKKHLEFQKASLEKNRDTASQSFIEKKENKIKSLETLLKNGSNRLVDYLKDLAMESEDYAKMCESIIQDVESNYRSGRLAAHTYHMYKNAYEAELNNKFNINDSKRSVLNTLEKIIDRDLLTQAQWEELSPYLAKMGLEIEFNVRTGKEQLIDTGERIMTRDDPDKEKNNEERSRD